MTILLDSAGGPAPPRQLVLELPHTESNDEADFLPSSCNRTALRHLADWRGWRSPATLLFGPEGSGKTHLARIWAARTRAVWLTGDVPWPDDPRDVLGPADHLVVDDAERIWDEVALFHLFNLITERRGRLLLTAPLPVGGWGIRLPDLRSRLALVAAVEIGAPDDALLAALYVKQLADRGLRPDPGTIDYLVAHGPRSFASVRAIVAELDRASLRARRPITMLLARGVLADHAARDGDQDMTGSR